MSNRKLVITLGDQIRLVEIVIKALKKIMKNILLVGARDYLLGLKLMNILKI